MSDIEFDCPKCHKLLTMDARGVGQRIKCPHCGGRFTMPSQAGERYDKFGQILPRAGAPLKNSGAAPAAIQDPSGRPGHAPLAPADQFSRPNGTAASAPGRVLRQIVHAWAARPTRPVPGKIKALWAVLLLIGLAPLLYITIAEKQAPPRPSPAVAIAGVPTPTRTAPRHVGAMTDDLIRVNADKADRPAETAPALNTYRVKHENDRHDEEVHALTE